MELLRVGSMAWETFVQQQHNMLTRVRASNSLLIRDKARLTDQNATLSRTVEQVKHTTAHVSAYYRSISVASTSSNDRAKCMICACTEGLCVIVQTVQECSMLLAAFSSCQ
jgi:hypothetical protein